MGKTMFKRPPAYTGQTHSRELYPTPKRWRARATRVTTRRESTIIIAEQLDSMGEDNTISTLRTPYEMTISEAWEAASEQRQYEEAMASYEYDMCKRCPGCTSCIILTDEDEENRFLEEMLEARSEREAEEHFLSTGEMLPVP